MSLSSDLECSTPVPVGLQHIVEYICKVPYRKSAYLCTLCARSLPANKIISHILGFDHIYWYLVSICVGFFCFKCRTMNKLTNDTFPHALCVCVCVCRKSGTLPHY